MEKRLKLLIIDDSEHDSQLAIHEIQAAGYIVYSQRVNTAEALGLALSSRNWDLILSEYSLTECNGVEMLLFVRSKNKDIPFIYFTNRISEAQELQGIQMGAQVCVNKKQAALLGPYIAHALTASRIRIENQTMHLALNEKRECFFQAFHLSGTASALSYLDGIFFQINRSFALLFGYQLEALSSLPLESMVEEESKAALGKAISDVISGKQDYCELEIRMPNSNKQTLWIVLNIACVQSGPTKRNPYLILQFHDRTEQQLIQERLRYLASYNKITGLYNKETFFEKLDECIALQTQPAFSLYFFNIDKFKAINNGYGSLFGDQLLKKIADRLKRWFKIPVLIGHMGGDEYMIANFNAIKEADCEQQAQTICNLIAEPIVLQNQRLSLTASLGIVLFPKDGTNLQDLFSSANTAYKEAKYKGGGQYCFYKPGLVAKPNSYFILAKELHQALENKALSIYFQPQISSMTGKPSGIEALVRWKKQGMILHPDDFIPIAEDNNLILKLNDEIFSQACQIYKNLQKKIQFELPFRLAVNFSARQLEDANCIKLIQRHLKKYRLKPEQLEIEITEHSLIAKVENAAKVTAALIDMGVSIAIDDFGVGNSSLSYLKDLSVSRLKIDRSFISSCIEDKNSRSITESIITMSHRLGLKVTAEGVENMAQKDFLVQQGCDELQGYLFSPPLSEKKIAEFLEKYK